MAAWILALGMETMRARATAAASDALLSGLGSPPVRAATVMLRECLENSAERLASIAAFLCLVVAHLECPDMHISFLPAGTSRSPGTLRRSHRASRPLGHIELLRSEARDARRGESTR